MSGCRQEMCSNWDGWGCPCEVLDLEPDGEMCQECGLSRLEHGAMSGHWCPVCGWEENPL
jgi:hypothetical protein